MICVLNNEFNERQRGGGGQRERLRTVCTVCYKTTSNVYFLVCVYVNCFVIITYVILNAMIATCKETVQP